MAAPLKLKVFGVRVQLLAVFSGLALLSQSGTQPLWLSTWLHTTSVAQVHHLHHPLLSVVLSESQPQPLWLSTWLHTTSVAQVHHLHCCRRCCTERQSGSPVHHPFTKRLQADSRNVDAHQTEGKVLREKRTLLYMEKYCKDKELRIYEWYTL